MISDTAIVSVATRDQPVRRVIGCTDHYWNENWNQRTLTVQILDSDWEQTTRSRSALLHNYHILLLFSLLYLLLYIVFSLKKNHFYIKTV